MPSPISIMLFALVMSLGPLRSNVCRSTSRYCGGRGRVWDWFLATQRGGCNCFRRENLQHRMRLEGRTSSPDTDVASFSRMSAPFTLHARSGGGGWAVEIKSRGVHVTESHWAKAGGAGSPLQMAFIQY